MKVFVKMCPEWTFHRNIMNKITTSSCTKLSINRTHGVTSCQDGTLLHLDAWHFSRSYGPVAHRCGCSECMQTSLFVQVQVRQKNIPQRLGPSECAKLSMTNYIKLWYAKAPFGAITSDGKVPMLYDCQQTAR